MHAKIRPIARTMHFGTGFRWDAGATVSYASPTYSSFGVEVLPNAINSQTKSGVGGL